jgi:hypothetical protein
MFTRLGRKIIQDNAKITSVNSKLIDDDDDDAFRRFDTKCELASDVYYGGGHSHGDEEEMDDEQRYQKAMYQLKCVTVVGLIFVTG